MKFTTTTAAVTIATLATLSAAAPASEYNTFKHVAKRDSSATQVFNSINSWIGDVDAVNSFLDTVGVAGTGLAGSALASAAQTALNYAMDEPNELKIQSNLSNLSPAGQAAAAALQANFGNVISSLQAIIANPNDVDDTVIGSLEIINGARCNIVLPNLDILWPAAALASGAPGGVPTAEVPSVCSQLN